MVYLIYFNDKLNDNQNEYSFDILAYILKF